MTASRLDTSDGAHHGDADPSGRRDDWDNVRFVCVHVSRPGPARRLDGSPSRARATVPAMPGQSMRAND